MLLSYTEICELIEQGVIENAKYGDVNSASLDLHLGPIVLSEAELPEGARPRLLDYRRRDRMAFCEIDITGVGYVLDPGDFILAHTTEVFHLPNNISFEYMLKSSMARIALDHLNAGWADAGWNGSALTLEFKNEAKYHSILLREGDAIGQIKFFRHLPVPDDRSYAVRGRYNGDLTVSGIK